MQLYAFDKSKRLVQAYVAQKQHNYFCIECLQRVRLRSGVHRQPHFYHIEPNHHCHLSGKGMIHLQVQFYIGKCLPPDDYQLEYRFAEINRIADVAWLSQKIIFEVQCSPISAAEVSQRNRDYQRLGWQVVWILHDMRYNGPRFTAAEWLLRPSPHYFTNINEQGEGFIYDRFDVFNKGIRQYQLAPLAIDIAKTKQLSPLLSYESQIPHQLFLNLALLQLRRTKWPIYFQGDLLDLSLKGEAVEYFLAAKDIERIHCPSQQKQASKWGKWIKNIFYYSIIRPYLLTFQMLLEKMCR